MMPFCLLLSLFSQVLCARVSQSLELVEFQPENEVGTLALGAVGYVTALEVEMAVDASRG